MEILNNLLKLTDYPFSYGIAGLLLLINGHGTVFTQIETFGPLLLIMGILGTTLSITDPIGNLMRFLCAKFALPRHDIHTSIRLPRSSQEPNTGLTDLLSAVRGVNILSGETQPAFKYSSSYLHSKASKSTWITYEIDKFVSMVYFCIILTTVVYFLFTSSLPNIICNAYVLSANITGIPFQEQIGECMSGSNTWIPLLILADIGIVVMIYFSLKKLFKYVMIVSGFFFGMDLIHNISKDGPHMQLVETVENSCKELLEYLNKKDWTMASIYWEKIAEAVRIRSD